MALLQRAGPVQTSLEIWAEPPAVSWLLSIEEGPFSQGEGPVQTSLEIWAEPPADEMNKSNSLGNLVLACRREARWQLLQGRVRRISIPLHGLRRRKADTAASFPLVGKGRGSGFFRDTFGGGEPNRT